MDAYVGALWCSILGGFLPRPFWGTMIVGRSGRIEFDAFRIRDGHASKFFQKPDDLGSAMSHLCDLGWGWLHAGLVGLELGWSHFVRDERTGGEWA
jgi:hypothetical protein